MIAPTARCDKTALSRKTGIFSSVGRILARFSPVFPLKGGFSIYIYLTCLRESLPARSSFDFLPR
jgi:hypothetical protein